MFSGRWDNSQQKCDSKVCNSIFIDVFFISVPYYSLLYLMAIRRILINMGQMDIHILLLSLLSPLIFS